MKRSAFITAVYGLVGIPDTHQNIMIGIAWAADEGSRANDNPLDTTEPGPGATDFNTVGVKNYPSWTEGIDETVATLQNGNYDAVLTALKDPTANVMDKLNAINSSPWGSHISSQLYADVVANPSQYDIDVTGSPADPAAPPDHTDPGIDVNTPKFHELPVLKVGSTGLPVFTLTAILHALGATYESNLDNQKRVLDIGNHFGPEVHATVADYQHSKGIASDGIVGPETWSSFFY